MHPRLHYQAQPEKAALIMATTSETVSYADLEARANRAAHLFRAFGFASGDTIALACGNRPEYLDIYWAAQRAGLTLVPLSTRFKADEIAYILQDSDARLLLIGNELADLALDLDARRGHIALLERLVSFGAVPGLGEWSSLCADQPVGPISDEQIGGRMSYSSGTTGRPKGIRFSSAGGSPVQPNPGAALFGRLYGLDDRTIYLSPAPLYHAAPLGFTAAVQALGGTVVLMQKFDPVEMLGAIEKYRVTVVQMVPTMMIRLLKLPEETRRDFDLSSLTAVVHAAAPCPIPVKQAMIDWLGPIVHEYYAGSEGNGHVVINSAEWLQKPGSVGRAVVGEIHICDDAGNELPVGEAGTIFFGGGKSFTYHNDQDKTASSRHPEHADWTTMGDVGRVDEDGYLFLSDRKDFMIISGGVNIYPQEIENLLVTHPAVADVAVFGIPNEEFGEEVKAVVQPADPDVADEALTVELIAWCRERLADVKCPRTIDFERTLPRGDNGKLYKKELVARYTARHTKSVARDSPRSA